MKNRNQNTNSRRYILVEFDGTNTKACTFRTFYHLMPSPDDRRLKGYQDSEARLHPDDEYDQCEGLRIALSRIGFHIENNPFSNILKALKLVADVFGDCTND